MHGSANIAAERPCNGNPTTIVRVIECGLQNAASDFIHGNWDDTTPHFRGQLINAQLGIASARLRAYGLPKSRNRYSDICRSFRREGSTGPAESRLANLIPTLQVHHFVIRMRLCLRLD